METFGPEYAALYDLFYRTKDYVQEAEILRRLFHREDYTPKRILDYGCGTGNRLRQFVDWGADVVGVDINPNMLTFARRKNADCERIQFYLLSTLKPEEIGRFDVVVCLFDVLSYMTEDDAIHNFFRFLEEVLVPEGYFIFDFWYGPGVTHLGPEVRLKEFNEGEYVVRRQTTPVHESAAHTVHVTHEVSLLEGDRILKQFQDLHHMRYFFRDEIDQFLAAHHFKSLCFGTWQNPDIPPSPEDWSALVVSRKSSRP